MKSALEIAMEKAKSMGGDEEIASLSDDQKKKVSEIRKEYEGKIAEREIMLETELKKFQAAAASPDIQDYISVKKEELAEEKKKLNAEMEEKIEKIRKET